MPTRVLYATADADWVPSSFIAQCKQDCRIDLLTADEDLPVSFAVLVPQAIQLVESLQWRIIQPKSLVASFHHRILPHACENRLWLPYGIRQSIPTLTVVDSEGDDAAVDAGDLLVSATTDEMSWISPGYDWNSWDDLLLNGYDVSTEHPDPCRVTWTCGYTSWADVPPSTVTAIRLMVKHLYYEPPGTGTPAVPESIRHWAATDRLEARELHRLLV